MTVWKYPLKLLASQYISCPKGAKPLFVANQDGTLTLWMQHDPGDAPCPKLIFVVGDGQPIPAEAKFYLGSALVGDFVWHVYSASLT